MDKEKYTMDVVCTNCGEKMSVVIPKGSPFSRYRNTILCPKCGCSTLEPYYKKPEYWM